MSLSPSLEGGGGGVHFGVAATRCSVSQFQRDNSNLQKKINIVSPHIAAIKCRGDSGFNGGIELVSSIPALEAIGNRPGRNTEKYSRDEVEHKEKFVEWLCRPRDGSAKRALDEAEHAISPKASEESVQDIFFNVEDWLIQEIGDTFAASEATAFVTGNSTSKPTGFLNASPVTTGDTDSPEHCLASRSTRPTPCQRLRLTRTR